MRDGHGLNAAGFIAISKQEVRRAVHGGAKTGPTDGKTANWPRPSLTSAIAPLASYREMLLDDFVSQLRDGALGDDAAPIQDRKIVGQLPAEFQILLHQKDRHGLLSQKLNSLATLVDDVGLDSLGWFVED